MIGRTFERSPIPSKCDKFLIRLANASRSGDFVRLTFANQMRQRAVLSVDSRPRCKPSKNNSEIVLRDRGESLTRIVCKRDGRIVKLDRRVVVGARADSRLCVEPTSGTTDGGYPYEIYNDLREHGEGVRTLGDANYETRDDFSDVRLKRRIFARFVTRLRLAYSRAIDVVRHAHGSQFYRILFIISLL